MPRLESVGVVLVHCIGFPEWGRLVGGDNLGKMAKNCMKITKLTFLAQNSGGTWGRQASFSGSLGRIPRSPPPPTAGNPAVI